MQISFSEAAPLLEAAMAEGLRRIGCHVTGQALSTYTQRKFEQSGASLLTTNATRNRALVELRGLEWDSKIYGLQIGTLGMFFDREETLENSELVAALARELILRAKEQGIKMLVARVGVDQLRWIQALEKVGFQIMDLQCPLLLREHMLRPSNLEQKSKIEIRPYEFRDLPELLALAKEAFGRSHLYADPRLPVSLTERLYNEWATNDCAGRASFVFSAMKGEDVVGFVAGLFDGDKEDLLGIRHGHIDLIAVRLDSRRSGVAHELMNQALRYYAADGTNIVTVSTQGSNLAAIRLYQNLGFAMQGLEVTMHCWLN